MAFPGMVPSQGVLCEREDAVRHTDHAGAHYCRDSVDLTTGFYVY